MMSLPKTMENNGKLRTFSEPNKIYIVRKVLMRAIQNVTFIELSYCVKSYGHLCQVLPGPLTKYGLSRGSGYKFQKVLFFA